MPTAKVHDSFCAEPSLRAGDPEPFVSDPLRYPL